MMLGDIVEMKLRKASTWYKGAVESLSDNGLLEYRGIELTQERMERNGFVFRNGLCILDYTVNGYKCRLAWNPNSCKFYLGYGELPHPVCFVHEVQQILRVCRLFDKANGFEL